MNTLTGHGQTNGRLKKWGCALAVLLLAGGTQAVTQYTWTNTAGGVFSTAGNWDPAGPPGAEDAALFNLDASYTVQFSANAYSTNFVVSDGAVLFDMGGFTYELIWLTNNPIRVLGTAPENPSLTITNGLVITETGGTGNNRAGIGHEAGTRGTLILKEKGQLSCNRFGLGQGSTGIGNVLVDGPDSELTVASWAEIHGQSSLIVTNQGHVQINGGANIATTAGGLVVLSFAGNGTTAHLQYINLGRRGAGIARIADGAVVTTFQTEVAGNHVDAVGELTVTGAGSKLTHTRPRSADDTHNFRIGAVGSKGTLIVEDGGLVETSHSSGTRVDILSPYGVLRGAGGTVSALRSGATYPGEILNEGLVAPGGTNTHGALTLIGLYTQTGDGTLRVKVSGKSTNDYDRLIVKENLQGDADVTLDGTVEVILHGVPLPDGAFDIIDTEGAITLESGLTVTLDTADPPRGEPADYETELEVVALGGREILRLHVIPPPRGTTFLVR